MSKAREWFKWVNLARDTQPEVLRVGDITIRVRDGLENPVLQLETKKMETRWSTEQAETFIKWYQENFGEEE